jgi:acetamidase/formamidase
MIRRLVADRNLTQYEAYVLCSVMGDLKINEIVDEPNWVVSMYLPATLFD